MRFNGGDNGVDRMLPFWSAGRGGVPMVAQTVAAMEPVRGFVFAMQRLFRADENRNIRAAELRRVERIARGLLHSNVAGDGGNRQHANLLRAQRHDQSHGVVRGRIGINQEVPFHAA